MTRRILIQGSTVDAILLEGLTDHELKEGVAQATDDVLLRFGPSTSTTAMTGLITSTFSAVLISSGGGGTVTSPYYYTMMSDWFMRS